MNSPPVRALPAISNPARVHDQPVSVSSDLQGMIPGRISISRDFPATRTSSRSNCARSVTGSRQSPQQRPCGRPVEDGTDILTQYSQVSFGQLLARVKAQLPV